MRAPALSDESVRVHEGVRSADKIEKGGGGARGVGGSDCLWVRTRSFPHHHPDPIFRFIAIPSLAATRGDRGYPL